MVGKINYSTSFIAQLDHLAKMLYIKQYFSYLEDLDNYINEIYDFVENNIESPISKNSPEPYEKFGKKYIRYEANHQTFWYIFYDQKGGQFLISHILDNHSQDFPELL